MKINLLKQQFHEYKSIKNKYIIIMKLVLMKKKTILKVLKNILVFIFRLAEFDFLVFVFNLKI